MKSQQSSHDIVSAASIAIALAIFGGIALHFLTGFAGAGHADYCFEMINGFQLARTSSKSRCVCDPANRVWIDSDIERIAWDNRYVYCRRFGPRIPHDATSPQGMPYLDWWIVDTVEKKLHGPLDEEKYEALVLEISDGKKVHLFPTEAYGRTGKELVKPTTKPAD